MKHPRHITLAGIIAILLILLTLCITILKHKSDRYIKPTPTSSPWAPIYPAQPTTAPFEHPIAIPDTTEDHSPSPDSTYGTPPLVQPSSNDTLNIAFEKGFTQGYDAAQKDISAHHLHASSNDTCLYTDSLQQNEYHKGYKAGYTIGIEKAAADSTQIPQN